jgi:hypothetical protein
MSLEDTQLHTVDKIFKLAIIGLIASVKIIQLVNARDGSSRPATDVIEPELLAAAEPIGKTLEGKTTRQQNPHPSHSLAWLAWIVARLGGWNCYGRPPGPKTMRAGWTRFAAMAQGYCIRAGLPAPKSIVGIP